MFFKNKKNNLKILTTLMFCLGLQVLNNILEETVRNGGASTDTHIISKSSVNKDSSFANNETEEANHRARL